MPKIKLNNTLDYKKSILFLIILLFASIVFLNYGTLGNIIEHSIILLKFNIIKFKTFILFTFLIGLWVYESTFSTTYFTFQLMRRRVDISKMPWESFQVFLEFETNNDYDDYDELHNSFYSNDGFFPKSFSEIIEFTEDSFDVRIDSILRMSEFFQYTLPKLFSLVETKFPTNSTFISSIVKTFKNSTKHIEKDKSKQENKDFYKKWWHFKFDKKEAVYKWHIKKYHLNLRKSIENLPVSFLTLFLLVKFIIRINKTWFSFFKTSYNVKQVGSTYNDETGMENTINFDEQPNWYKLERSGLLPYWMRKSYYGMDENVKKSNTSLVLYDATKIKIEYNTIWNTKLYKQKEKTINIKRKKKNKHIKYLQSEYKRPLWKNFAKDISETNMLISRVFKIPFYYLNVFSISQMTDYSDIGIALTSGTADDASTYIYEVQPPIFYEINDIPILLKKNVYDLTYVESLLMYPQPFVYNEETVNSNYPINQSNFFVKRDWDENPDMINFRDATSKIFSNITRLPTQIHLNFNYIIQENFIYHTLPRSLNKSLTNSSIYTIFNQYYNESKYLTNFTSKSIPSSIITTEFPRQFNLSNIINVFKGFVYYLKIDNKRSRKLYMNLPAELSMIPLFHIVQKYLNKIFFFQICIFIFNLSINKFSLKMKNLIIWNRFNLTNTKNIQENLNIDKIKQSIFFKYTKFTFSRLITNYQNLNTDNEITQKKYDLLIFRHKTLFDFLREVIALSTLSLTNKNFVTGRVNLLSFSEHMYSFEQKFAQDSSLMDLPFYYEEDRFYSDFEYINTILKENNPFDINNLDIFKSFHSCEYEYIVEEDDYFEQSTTDPIIQIFNSILLIIFVILIFKSPLIVIYFLLSVPLYFIILAEIYHAFKKRTIFSAYKSSLINHSMDNVNGEVLSLIYPRLDFTFGNYPYFNLPINQLEYIELIDLEYRYQEDDTGGESFLHNIIAYEGFEDVEDDESYGQLLYDENDSDQDFNQEAPESLSIAALDSILKRYDSSKYFRETFMEDPWNILDMNDYEYIQDAEQHDGVCIVEGEEDGHFESFEDGGDTEQGSGLDLTGDDTALYNEQLFYPLILPVHNYSIFSLFPSLSFFADIDSGEEDFGSAWEDSYWEKWMSLYEYMPEDYISDDTADIDDHQWKLYDEITIMDEGGEDLIDYDHNNTLDEEDFGVWDDIEIETSDFIYDHIDKNMKKYFIKNFLYILKFLFFNKIYTKIKII
jgi:hypothetical protein